MRKRTKTMLSLICVLALCLSLAVGAFAYTDEEIAQIAADAQRALDIQAVENIMNRHVLYHCYGEHQAEMEEIWVQEPQNQATASFGQNQGYHVGYDDIYAAYVTGHDSNWLAAAKSYCEENGIDTSGMTDEEIVEIYGGVGQLLLHVTTTAIIEIAEDGQTAKGYWYSPGMIAETGMSPNSIWEAYGVDFIKENGEWKMWHLHMFTDFMCQFGDTFGSASGEPGGGSGEPSGAGSGEPSGEPGGQINYEGEQGVKELTEAADRYVYSTEYTQFNTGRLRSEMEVIPIPMPYETWSFDVENYGPTIEEYASVGVDVAEWYAAMESAE